MRRRVLICSARETTVNPPRELRIGVPSEKRFCAKRYHGDELIKHLKEWEKGWQSR